MFNAGVLMSDGCYHIDYLRRSAVGGQAWDGSCDSLTPTYRSGLFHVYLA
jgi:hypothetical protein